MLDRSERFSPRVLMAFAKAGLPETLAVRAASAEGPAEILLYDEIGPWGVTAKDFASALKDAGRGPITLRINSPGGSVFDGMAMFNATLQHGGVSVVVDGVAASAASVVAMGGASLAMHETSLLMIHNAWGLAMGNSADMVALAAVLSKIDTQMAAVYAGKTGAPVADMAALMDAETWMTAAEASAAKFADSVIAAKPKADATARVVASFAARRPPIPVAEPDTTERDLLMLRLQLAAAVTA